MSKKLTNKRVCVPAAALAMVLVQACASAAIVRDVYVAQSATGANTGQSCTSAYAYTFFSNSSNWGTSIGPGTTVHICGTITVAAGANAFVFQGSGTSGSPIRLLFEPGAIVQSPAFPGDGGASGCGGGICLYNRSYVAVDGGTNGVIQNTNNGDQLGLKAITTLIDGYKCSNCEITNLHMLNAYVKVRNGGNAVGGDQQRAAAFSGSNWNFHDNVIDHCGWCVFQHFGNGDNNTNIYNTEISHFGHALMYATAGANRATNYFLHDNYIHDSDNWVNLPNCDYHNDGLHTFTTGGGSMDGVYIFNNWFGGQWTLNTDSSSCATGFVFIESGTFSPSNATNVGFWNNVAFIPSNSKENSNSWIGMFECRGGSCLVANNTIVGPGDGTGGDNTVCLSMQRQTGITYHNNVIVNCGNPVEISNSTIAVANNNFYGPSCQNGSNCFTFNQSFKGSFAAWKSACGCDANGIQSNSPGLASDGSPTAGSPVIGRGLNLASLALGNLVSLLSDTSKGNRRSPVLRLGLWDMGAYQYSGTGAILVSPPESLTAAVAPQQTF